VSFSNQEMTDHDLATWTDDLLTRIELRVLMEHEVINHQRNDAVFQNRCSQSVSCFSATEWQYAHFNAEYITRRSRRGGRRYSIARWLLVICGGGA
jgi:hypothetical protein